MGIRWSFVVILVAAAGNSCVRDNRTASFDGLDAFLDSMAVAHQVPGYSFAAFDDQAIVHQRAHGYKNADTREAVDSETVFEAASISKPVFAYVVLTLARDGVLSLDASIGKTAPVVRELGHDVRSEILTPQMLLTHQGGLPNWRSRMDFTAESYEALFGPTDTLKFVANPGIEYQYSGEGYVLLQQVVEQTANRGLNALAHEMVFDPLHMTRSSYLFDAKMQANASWGHDRAGRPDKWRVTLPLASSTLHTTALDLATFGVHLASGIQRGEYYASLATPEARVGSRGGWEGYWGLGMGVATDSTGSYMYHGGNNVIFVADFIYGFRENLGYALLTNSANGGAMIESIERRIYGKDIPR